ncbi:small membrane protein YdgU [Atlantibacter subterraneus]
MRRYLFEILFVSLILCAMVSASFYW